MNRYRALAYIYGILAVTCSAIALSNGYEIQILIAHAIATLAVLVIQARCEARRLKQVLEESKP